MAGSSKQRPASRACLWPLLARSASRSSGGTEVWCQVCWGFVLWGFQIKGFESFERSGPELRFLRRERPLIDVVLSTIGSPGATSPLQSQAPPGAIFTKFREAITADRRPGRASQSGEVSGILSIDALVFLWLLQASLLFTPYRRLSVYRCIFNHLRTDSLWASRFVALHFLLHLAENFYRRYLRSSVVPWDSVMQASMRVANPACKRIAMDKITEEREAANTLTY